MDGSLSLDVSPVYNSDSDSGSDGWMDGWMDEWMDGCMDNNGLASGYTISSPMSLMTVVDELTYVDPVQRTGEWPITDLVADYMYYTH